MAASGIDGIHKAEALLGYSESRRVGHVYNPDSDVVTLSDVALAMIQARIGVDESTSALEAGIKMDKALIDVKG